MRKAILAFIVLVLTAQAGVRVNRTITVAAGTPVRLATTHIYAAKIFIQMQTGGSGRGFIMAGIPSGTTPAATTSAHLTAELSPATATGPGGSYSDSDYSGIDLSLIWVDGSNTGDKITFSYEVYN